jgi:arylsulfatase A-like enzyme
MRHTILPLLVALSLVLPGAGAGEPKPTSSSPNVILILADDLGWAELGCHGNTFNETPALDQLAKQGVRFTHAYAAAPVCSPTRAALLAGQYPARMGITDYLRPYDPAHLSPTLQTLAKLLKLAGYVTGLVGKWHLTGYEHHSAKEVPPSAHGFDEVLVSEKQGIGAGSYFFPYHFNPAIKQRIQPKEHLVDRCNLEAVEFIERHKSKPFFLYLSHYAVHTKLDGKPELVAKYEQKPGAGKGPLAKKNNPHLAAQLEGIDQGLALITKKLQELGLADNTIIVFTSDNGGEVRVTSNAPLRGGKSTLYEGGVRVPLLVRWPGVTPAAGATCNTPVITMDLFATVLEAAGAKADAGQPVDGLSLVPLLKDPKKTLPRPALYWHYPLAKPHFLGGRSCGAVRAGDFKLIEDFTTGKLELYDLKVDTGEHKDLSVALPDKAKELQVLLKSWRQKIGAKIIKHQ